jgi:nucleotide-binding universal stress UspA family protein
VTSDSTISMVFPVHDLQAAQAAVPVMLAVARMLDAPLNLIVSRQACPDVRDLERALAMPAGALDGASVESANGDFAAAVERVVRRAKPALLLLAVRLRDDEGAIGAEASARSNPVERQMMERASCPVLIVPPDQDAGGWRLRRELLPQDGSPECVVALEEIIDRSSRGRPGRPTHGAGKPSNAEIHGPSPI